MVLVAAAGAVGGSVAASVTGAIIAKAKIINTSNPLDFVLFDLNPADITITHQSSFTTVTSTAAPSGAGAIASALALMQGNTGPQLQRVGLTKLKMTAMFDQDHAELMDKIPGSVRRRCELLGAWTRPDGGSLIGALGKAAVGAISSAISGGGPQRINPASMPPLLLFQWGDPFAGGFAVQGYIDNVSAKYLRFDSTGNPIRAQAMISFVQEPKSMINTLTNPTSGGLPGRKAHVVGDGENLQTIAMATYGRPGLWRKIADVNGIDDPMRVRVGSTIYLPGPSEIG
jgi:nucleoid-associated protein YgaU